MTRADIDVMGRFLAFYDKDTKEHLFGNYLENAVASFTCNDNVKMPAPIRICIDIIEQKGRNLDRIG